MTIGMKMLSKLLEEGRYREFGKLRPEWFVQDESKAYESIQNFIGKYGVLPSSEIIFKKATSTSEPYAYLLDEILKRNLTNSFMDAGVSVKTLLQEGKVFDAFNHMKEFVMRNDITHLEARDMYTYSEMGEMVEDYLQTHKGSQGLIGIPSGWPSLDSATAGWQPGNVYAYLARPKMGKSIIMARNADYAFNQGAIPLLVSMEMGTLEMARRMIAIRAGINMNNMKRATVSEWGIAKIRNVVADLKTKHPFYFIEGQFKKDLTEIGSLIHGLRPDIVLIDGGYLIKLFRSANKSKWEKMTDIAEGIKEIASIGRVPIVVSFQFNRKTKKNDADTAGFETIQLADAIGQIASVGIGIFEDDENPYRRRIDVIGGREGEEATFFINWLWETMDFTEIVEVPQIEGEEEWEDEIQN